MKRFITQHHLIEIALNADQGNGPDSACIFQTIMVPEISGTSFKHVYKEYEKHHAHQVQASKTNTKLYASTKQ